MATVNLGRIKPVFRGAYSGSTAYVVDDIVTHGNESFICIQAHGAGTQATTEAAYWTKLAAKGTDGTDVGTTITTQGDILYRDGSGLQRLAKGTAAQVLAINSGATAPEWVDASGGSHEAITSGSFSSVSDFTISTLGTGFEMHILTLKYRPSANDGNNLRLRFSFGGSVDTSSNYTYVAMAGNSAGGHGVYTGEGQAYIQVSRDGARDSSEMWIEMQFLNLLGTTAGHYKSVMYRCNGVNHDGAHRMQSNAGSGLITNSATTACDGLQFIDSTGGTITGTYKMWGRKY